MDDAVCWFCGGALYWIGQLGSVGWRRCRDCGADQSDPEPVDDDPADERTG
jgi:hypothetical protein